MNVALSSERRRRLTARLAPLVTLAVAAFAVGLLVGAGHEPRQRSIAERFVDAWERGEVASMYELLDASSRRRYTLDAVRELYDQAARASTLRSVRATSALRNDGETFRVAMTADTRVFGTVAGDLTFAVTTDADDLVGVAFDPSMVFPGLGTDETLSRTTKLAPRAGLQARDGEVLAEGPDRVSELGTLASEVVGSIGPIPAEEADRYAAMGYPKDATVGLTGLERQFESRLVGKLGGTLRASGRVLAEVEPEQASPVRTSIDIDLEAAAVTALAGRLGGIAVLRPDTGEVLALAGYDCCLPQPPGSTFKIITLAGALENGIVEPGDTYPVVSSALLSGVELQNANGELCGGTLEQVFAHSCNSAFGPMGAELGAEKLVETAEAFGFNQPTDVTGAPPGSIPAAGEIGDDLAVGSSAIGQGQVTTNPLRMAEVAATIANGGVRVRPVFGRGQRGERKRVVSRRTARIITRYMRAVVDYGTGTAAEIEGEDIAGKTGTAELRTTQPDPNDPEAVVEQSPEDTDAWFVAFAPAKKPRVVVSVMLIGAGAGGETAAPAARIVLDAAL